MLYCLNSVKHIYEKREKDEKNHLRGERIPLKGENVQNDDENGGS